MSVAIGAKCCAFRAEKTGQARFARVPRDVIERCVLRRLVLSSAAVYLAK
jgi:hypothetical protein